MSDPMRSQTTSQVRGDKPSPPVYIRGMGRSAAPDARLEEPKINPDLHQINPDLHEVVLRVHHEYDERLDPLAVEECLSRVAATFDNATVRAFVPLLVRRYVHDELQERLERV